MSSLRRLMTERRGRLRDVTLVAALIVCDFVLPFLIAGLISFCLGSMLHFWSKGVLTRNWALTTGGPYRLVRNPFYLANFLIDIGICLMAGSGILALIYIPAYLLTYLPTIRSEERFLRETHNEAFDRYAARTPRLLPWRIGRLLGPLDFSWDIIEQEQEIPRLLRILAMPFYLVLVHAVFRTPDDPSRTVTIILSIVAVLSLQAGSLLARHHNRRQMLCGY